MADARKRPFIITLIGILYGLVAVVWIAVGIAALVLGETMIGDMVADNPDLGFLGGMSTALSIASIVIGLVYALICAGFMRGWSVMWYLGVVFSVIGALAGLLSLLLAQIYMIVDIAICLITLLYLFKPNVKSFFLGRRRPSGARPPQTGGYF